MKVSDFNYFTLRAATYQDLRCERLPIPDLIARSACYRVANNASVYLASRSYVPYCRDCADLRAVFYDLFYHTAPNDDFNEARVVAFFSVVQQL